MFLAKAGECEPCRLFSIGHLILVILTTIGVIVTLKKTIHKSKEEVHKIIIGLTITVWILEILKIIFNMYNGAKLKNVKEWIPLYYCSVLLYAGLLSSFGKGNLRRIGDVFIATGSIVGGLVFIVFPTTSLPTYPMFHFISLHSFFFHGTMIYLSILVNKTHYIEVKAKDEIWFAILIGIVCLAALFVNIKFNSNLMFISKNFPGTPISIIYNLLGRMFTPAMIIGQMIVPFYMSFLVICLLKKRRDA